MQEFLEQKGKELHHVLLNVDDFDKTISVLEKKGVGVLVKGDWKGLTYVMRILIPKKN